ncbi:MAG: TetR family transcriptional regulator [Caulobacteraceae bacterium]|nr:TetR family transcriptional regulator [Caulobacteraceae bacterium]
MPRVALLVPPTDVPVDKMALDQPASTSTAKTTPKSLRTRKRILDAAMELFAERGYHASSNADVAEAAGLTRGAMLYHFPTREDLVEAAIDHIQMRRTEAFESAARDQEQHGDATDQAIDAYWELLHQAPFKAFAELEAVARTDPDLARRIAPAQAAFDHAQIGDLSHLLLAGSGARFQTGRDLARFMLEGLARASLTYGQGERTERLLTVIKRVTRVLNRKGSVQELWED